MGTSKVDMFPQESSVLPFNQASLLQTNPKQNILREYFMPVKPCMQINDKSKTKKKESYLLLSLFKLLLNLYTESDKKLKPPTHVMGSPFPTIQKEKKTQGKGYFSKYLIQNQRK